MEANSGENEDYMNEMDGCEVRIRHKARMVRFRVRGREGVNLH